MAFYSPVDVVYYLLLDINRQDDLTAIRSWHNLKIAFDGTSLWVKDLDYTQITSVAVKSLPYKTIYYAHQGMLYLQYSHLPDRTEPPLLWTSIERAFPYTLPSYNHNYFGIKEKIPILLHESAQETDAIAMIAPIKMLGEYVVQAPKVRLAHLRWALLGTQSALIYGTPIIPIPAPVYWSRGDALLPVGYDFELYALSEILISRLNPAKDSYVLWHTDGSYSIIPKNALQQLSIGSFRLSATLQFPTPTSN